MMLLAEQGVPFHREIQAVTEWPEKWIALLQYCKHYQNVMERAAFDKDPKAAFPPAHILWGGNVEAWFESRKNG